MPTIEDPAQPAAAGQGENHPEARRSKTIAKPRIELRARIRRVWKVSWRPTVQQCVEEDVATGDAVGYGIHQTPS